MAFRRLRIWILLSLVLGLSACQTEIPPNEYGKYVRGKSNGLCKEKVVGDIKMELQYKPPEYMALSQTDGEITEGFEGMVEAVSGLQHYNMKLSVSANGNDITDYKAKTPEEQQRRIEYLSFAMQHDIRLVQGLDTLPCALYHFERSYDVAPHRTFVLAFEDRGAGDRTLVWDSPIFGTGPVKIGIRQQDIQNIPNLKTGL